MLYTGELGTYEKGRRVVVEASSPREAYDLLYRELPISTDCECDPEDQYVVQIFEGNYLKCVFDYLNGFEIYEMR